MKALILCTETDRIWGGRGEHVQQVCKRLPALGVEPLLVTVDGNWLSPPNYFTTSIQGVTNHFIPRTNEESRLSNQWAWVQTAAKVIKEHGADVIHAHDWDAVEVALSLRDIFDIPVVTSFHLFQHQLVTEMGQEETHDTTIAITAELRGLAMSDAVTYCSKNMRDYANNRMVPRSDGQVLYNGVDAEEWRPGAFRSKRSVMFCGRLCEQKGYESFLDAAEKDVAREFSWIVMGKVPALEGPAAEATPVMQKTRKLEAAGVITYLGHLYGKRRCTEIRMSQTVVVPSVKEPFGIIALEAMAAGCKLLTTRVDGLAEFCDDTNSFQLTDIYSDVCRIVNEPSKDASDTLKKFTWDKCAKETVRIYAETCSTEGGRRRGRESLVHHA